MECTNCGKVLIEALDVYGAVGEEVCLDCHVGLEYESSLETDERGPFEWMYGFFGSGDPRDFTPDFEQCTAEEIARWKADVELAESGNTVIAPPAGKWHYSSDGTPIMHVLAPKYGIGAYKYRPMQEQL